MNRGLMLKTWRETWSTTALFILALGVAELALGYVVPRFASQFADQLAQLPFLQGLIRALVGAEAADSFGPDVFRSLPWVHPVALALLWGHAIVHCTRIPAGEVDRGTIDVLLGLPVSRWQVHLNEGVVWLASGLALVGAAVAGNLVGGFLYGSVAPSGRIGIVAINALLLYTTVGGFAWLMASITDRRGRAIAGAFAFVAASFLLSYLTQFWKPLEPFGWLSIMRYDRPMNVLRDGAWPLRDLVILGVATLAAWIGAGWVFSRRDLATT